MREQIAGGMSMGWSVHRIKQVCDFNPSCPITPSETTVVSYAPMECVRNGYLEHREIVYGNVSSGLTYFADGDIVMAKVTPCFENGNIAIADGLTAGIGFGSSELFVFRPKTINTRWLFYYLQNPDFISTAKATMTGTGGLKRVSPTFVRNHSFIAPPLAEQGRIAAYLDRRCATIDTLIANQQQQIEKLKQYKQAVITEAVTRGLDPNVQMKDSGVEWIGQVPEHWEIIPSKWLFANCDERRRDSDEQMAATQKYGVISQKEYMERENCRIVLADKGLESWKHVEPNDFVISLRSFQGGLEFCEKAGCVTWHYIVLRARREVNYRYYKWLFKSRLYIQALQHTCNYIRDGQDLRYSNFVQVPLCIPSLCEQEAIADFIDTKCAQIDALIAVKQQKADKLAQYKKSLIYEVVTGKREISEGGC